MSQLESIDTEWGRFQHEGASWNFGRLAAFVERLWYALEAASQSKAPADPGGTRTLRQQIEALPRYVSYHGGGGGLVEVSKTVTGFGTLLRFEDVLAILAASSSEQDT